MTKKNNLSTRITIVGIISLLLVWATVAYEIARSQRSNLHEAELLTATRAQVFAEYSESTIKRLNELLLDLRSYWTGDWKTFAELVQRRQENIADIAFQVAVIDKDGWLAFSNLAKPGNRTDLGEREHFRVHKDAPDADRLFISKPLKGKVSGKWSIQFTRPIIHEGEFNGVLVISVSPELFSSFGDKLQLGAEHSVTVIRDGGEIMARHPVEEKAYGLVIKDRPFLQANAPKSGNYRATSATDNVERLFGFHKLPAYGLNFLVGESLASVLQPYETYRATVIGIGAFISLFAGTLFLGLIRSLKVLEQTRAELENAKERAELANQAKTAFLSNISHEMRTPLHQVLGFSQLVEIEPLSEKQKEWVSKLNASAGNLNDLINRILKLTEIEVKHLQLEAAALDIPALLDEILMSQRALAKAKGLQLNSTVSGVPAPLLGDKEQLRSALSYYIDNAIKFTQSGSIDVSIEPIEESRDGVTLRFAVRDTGIGIAPEALPRLFSIFEQVDNSSTRKFGGTGIGLAMVKKLAQLMGGDAGCESAVGQGSTFWFTARFNKP